MIAGDSVNKDSVVGLRIEQPEREVDDKASVGTTRSGFATGRSMAALKAARPLLAIAGQLKFKLA